MELIIVEDKKLQLNDEIIDKICNFEMQIKEIKQKQDELRAKIKKEMEEKGIKGIETDKFTINYVEEFDTIRLDQKLIKEKYPDIADECSKISHTKSQIKFSFKK